MKVLVSGSSGLVGSEIVTYFDRHATSVVGIDNDTRKDLFGPEGSTSAVLQQLHSTTHSFEHCAIDIRDRPAVMELLNKEGPFELIVHCAGQPSHDLSARRPLDDFDINALGTLNLLEATRRFSPQAVFVLLSTNKVYGDAPNELPLRESRTRWDYALQEHRDGIDEGMRMDQSLHSPFGVSKSAADLAAQEYGRYFGLKTTILRCGCITGERHAGVELHGFVSHLVRNQVRGGEYRVFGHKGKQVRDVIHSLDLARLVHAILNDPGCGQVFNVGGGRNNSCSVIEALDRVAELTGRAPRWTYLDSPRPGDHICYITNVTRVRRRYPSWSLTRDLDSIFERMVDHWSAA